MIAPTATDVQGWTNLTDLKDADDTVAVRTVAVAGSLFQRITGLKFTDVQVDDEPVVQMVVQGLSELVFVQQSADTLDTLSDFDLIQSFSAGPYSETRRDPDAARKARLLVAWPWLSELLWGLLTPGQYDYWMEFFSDPTEHTPAFAVTEVDWSGTRLDPAYWWGA